MFSTKSEIKFTGALAVAAALLLFLPYVVTQLAPKTMTRELFLYNEYGRTVWAFDALGIVTGGFEDRMLQKVREYYFFPISYMLYKLTGNRSYRTL